MKLGIQQGDQVTLREGLMPGTPVVTRGAILLDAEATHGVLTGRAKRRDRPCRRRWLQPSAANASTS